ncbi:MAG: hypothetical protein ACK5H2_08825 [Beutenbergiaceae bacterium]
MTDRNGTFFPRPDARHRQRTVRLAAFLSLLLVLASSIVVLPVLPTTPTQADPGTCSTLDTYTFGEPTISASVMQAPIRDSTGTTVATLRLSTTQSDGVLLARLRTGISPTANSTSGSAAVIGFDARGNGTAINNRPTHQYTVTITAIQPVSLGPIGFTGRSSIGVANGYNNFNTMQFNARANVSGFRLVSDFYYGYDHFDGAATEPGDAVLSGVEYSNSTPRDNIYRFDAPGWVVEADTTPLAAGQTLAYTFTGWGFGAFDTATNLESHDVVLNTDPRCAISFDKSGTVVETDGNPGIGVGDRIDYTFPVVNNGFTTLNSITLTDPQATGIACPQTSLAPGASMICTAGRTLAAADFTAGSRTNTATISGTDGNEDTQTAQAFTTTPIPAIPAMTMTKSGAVNDTNADGDADAGETITYTMTVRNSGGTPLSDLTILDARGTVSCATTGLTIGQSTTCTLVYSLKQPDIDAGAVPNSATATATAPGGVPVSAGAGSSNTIPSVPGISLAKTAQLIDGNADGQIRPGESIRYTFTVTNTGNTLLTGIAVADVMGTPACADTSLPPQTQTSCTLTVTLTDAHVDAGAITNSATATGSDPAGSAVTDDTSLTTTIARLPELTLTKNATTASFVEGALVDYTIVVRNTGNVTLTDVAVTDPLVSDLTCPAITSLAADAALTCTATHTVTSADVLADEFRNTATATATAPVGPPVSASDDAVVPVTDLPALTLDKSGQWQDVDGDHRPSQGDRVVYELVVTNTGNVSLTDIDVEDLSTLDEACPAPTTIYPGQSVTCTASHTLTWADIETGSLLNSATASGTHAPLAPVTASHSTQVELTRIAGLTLTKSGVLDDADTDGVLEAGEAIDYTITVTNTGNVALTAVSVDDDLGVPACSATTLAVGGTMTCQLRYTLTEQDVVQAAVTNTAIATATSVIGAVDGAGSSTTAIPVVPLIDLSKTGTVNATGPGGSVVAGDVVDYQITVSNPGNVVVTELAVTDSLGSTTCETTSAVHEQEVLCTLRYTLTQADIDAGTITNEATVTGSTPAGTPVTASGQSTNALPSAPGIGMVKIGEPVDADADGHIGAADQISYRFLITNRGNTTLTGMRVTDALGPVTCPSDAVGAGAAIECTLIYQLDQNDVDAGTISNSATAFATDPHATEVSGPASTDTAIPSAASISLTKDSTGDFIEGGTALYTFHVVNTGNVTLDGIVLTDDRVSDEDCPADTLAPGAEMTCTASYTLTVTDIANNGVDNTATITADAPDDTTTSATSSDHHPALQDPGLTLSKVAELDDSDGDSMIEPGELVVYTFTVTNSGNVTLTDVTVGDDMGSPICPTNVLIPGQPMTCTMSYVLSAAQVDAGAVTNQATVTGSAPDDSIVTAQASATTPIERLGLLTVAKSGEPGPFASGDRIDYTIVVSNEGNLSLDPVTLDDPLTTDEFCPAAALAAGESMVCTASHVVTPAEVAQGSVTNTATAVGTSSTGPVTGSGSTDSDFVPEPAISIVKSSSFSNPDGDNSAEPGEQLRYDVRVENTGNVPLAEVAVSDTLGALACDPGTVLVPGEMLTCRLVRTLTQADVDSGTLTNTATATATGPAGAVVSDDDTVVDTIAAHPSISLVKSETTDPPTPAGTIAYTFVVTNTGNVTLTGVDLTDDLVSATCAQTTLVAAAQMQCTASYTITTGDVDRGFVTNHANVSGNSPGGIETTDTAYAATYLPTQPSLMVTKLGARTDTDGDGVIEAGEFIDYRIAVVNTGNVTIDLHQVTDALGTPACAGAELAPGAAIQCTLRHSLTQAQIDAGSIANTAIATGQAPGGADVSATGQTLTQLPADPGITISKNANVTEAAIGEKISYDIVVSNTGNVTLTGITVTDPLAGAPSCSGDAIAPGTYLTCHAEYQVERDDVASGVLTNIATATGSSPVADISGAGRSDVTILGFPEISGTKSAQITDLDGDGMVEAGDVISYAITVHNSGTADVTAITVTDPMGEPDCDRTTVVPDQTATCTFTMVLTQDQIDAGSLTNTATITATGAGKALTSAPSVTTPLPSRPAAAVAKAGEVTDGGDGTVGAGDSIDYLITVTNTGNVTLTGLAVADPLGTPSCDQDQLAPGQIARCTLGYTLTHQDVIAGKVDNTAVMSAGTGATATTASASTSNTLPRTWLSATGTDAGRLALAAGLLTLLGAAVVLVSRTRSTGR